VKRDILYLNVKSGAGQGRSAGFCRVDQIGNRIKIGVNINNNLQIDYMQIESIRVKILYSNGNCLEYEKEFKNNTLLIDVRENETVVGIEIIYIYKNGIKIKVAGGREIVEKIKQVELEDTVYNVDMECVKEKKITTASVDEGPMKISIAGLAELPREYWHLMKNKFVNCCYGRYGYIGYLKRDDKYIICIPGDMCENECGCARKYGFNTYIEAEDESNKGYWLWGGNGSKSNKQ